MVAFAIGTALAAGVFVAPQAGFAAPGDPVNPTDGQLRSAAAQKSALAGRVGVLSGQLAEAQRQLQVAQNASAIAEQKVAYAFSRLRDATDATERANQATVAAKQKFAKASKQVVDQQTRFARYMQAVYMDGSPNGLTGTMLTADDPNAVLQQSSYQAYEVQHNVGVIGAMQTVTVAKSNAAAEARNAEAKARRTEKIAEQRKNESVEAQQAAATTVQNQAQRENELTSTVSSTQTELDSANIRLATLNGQRAKYVAFVVERERQAALERQRIARLKAQKAEADRQKKIAAQRQAALEREREKARERDRKNSGGKKSGGKKNGGSNSGGSNSGGGSYNPPPVNAPPKPGNGKWTQAKAVKALNRAKSTLGTPYAWAGGGPGGPSYGACVPSAGAPYDCNIRGYDCSGLVMYAWGKNWDHYADTQYTQAGRVHPKKSQLRIGDLVFFGNRSGGEDLHHVAMYAGHGKIIEAPYSGGYVQYNSLNAYSDYYGATRPLT